MFKSLVPTHSWWLTPAALLVTSFTLAGCMMDEAADYTSPAQSAAFYERYPISVRKTPVKMGVATRGGTLQGDQMNAVANFARDARFASVSRVNIRYPSGSAKGRQAARDAVEVAATQGIPPEMISVSSYPGGAGSPLQLSYERKVAVTRECGDWSQNLAADSRNAEYPNFGCAYQHNVAAMVANAEDFERPRAETPIVAVNRTAAMKVYFESVTEVQSQVSTSTDTTTTGSSKTSASN